MSRDDRGVLVLLNLHTGHDVRADTSPGLAIHTALRGSSL